MIPAVGQMTGGGGGYLQAFLVVTSQIKGTNALFLTIANFLELFVTKFSIKSLYRDYLSSSTAIFSIRNSQEVVYYVGSSDGGATSVCGGNLSDSTAEGIPPTMDAYDTDATSLVSSAHHIYQCKHLNLYLSLLLQQKCIFRNAERIIFSMGIL